MKKPGKTQKFTAAPKEGKKKRMGGASMSALFGVTPKKPDPDVRPLSTGAVKAARRSRDKRLKNALI